MIRVSPSFLQFTSHPLLVYSLCIGFPVQLVVSMDAHVPVLLHHKGRHSLGSDAVRASGLALVSGCLLIWPEVTLKQKVFNRCRGVIYRIHLKEEVQISEDSQGAWRPECVVEKAVESCELRNRCSSLLSS